MIAAVLRGEDGLSLAELMIGTLISMVVLLLATAALGAATRTDSYTEHHSRALDSLRVATERVGKEARQAHRIYSDSHATRLHMGIDRNRDGAISPNERTVWTVAAHGGTSALFRIVAEGTLEESKSIVAPDLVAGPAFTFRRDGAAVTDPSRAQEVGLSFTADAAPGRHAGPRTVTTTVRLRNVA
ncbi:MAG TPA: hypothetical protein VM840_13360 [Actinomycetota bacterium]|nr:hypothetical protein [Actinomycetota bacterium]